MSSFEKNDDFLSLQDPKKQDNEETSSSKKKNRKRRRVSESDSNSNKNNPKEEGEETSTITKDGKTITTITTTMTKGRWRNDPRGRKGKTRKEREEEEEAINISPEELKKYERGAPLPLDGIKDKKLKGKLSKVQKINKTAAQKAAMAEILITTEPGFIETEGMEKSFKVKQSDVKASVDVQSAKKVCT
jgi:hypothetical protein